MEAGITTEKPFSIERALRDGWRLTMAHLWPLIGLGAVGAFLGLLQSALNQPGDRAWFLRGLLSLCVSIAEVVVGMVWIRTALRLRAGQPPALGQWTDVFPRFWSFLLTKVLLAVVVGVGLALLIVPGVILALTYGLAGFAVMDRGVDPFDAFRESRRITHGVKAHLLLFYLALLGINLLGALALGIGLFVTVPVTFLAATDVYQQLRARAGEPIGPWTTTPLGPTEVHA